MVPGLAFPDSEFHKGETPWSKITSNFRTESCPSAIHLDIVNADSWRDVVSAGVQQSPREECSTTSVGPQSDRGHFCCALIGLVATEYGCPVRCDQDQSLTHNAEQKT